MNIGFHTFWAAYLTIGLVVTLVTYAVVSIFYEGEKK